MNRYVRKIVSVFLSICLIVTMMPVVPGIYGTAYGETNETKWLLVHDQQDGDAPVKYEDLTVSLDYRETGGWFWDAEIQTLILDGYHGGSIQAKGNLHIRIEGENDITTRNDDGILVEDGSLTIDQTTDAKKDTLNIDVTQTHAGTVNDCSGISAAEAILNGGSVSVDYRLAVDTPHINTISGGARGISGKVSVYHGANLHVKADSDQSVTSNRGISGTLSVYGSGNVSVELDAVYEGRVEAVIGVGGFYASNLSTATVVIDAENHVGQNKATAIGMLQGVHFDQGGSLEVKNGCIHGKGNYYTGIVADNIVVSPAEYIFFYPGSASTGDLCDPEGNTLYGDVLFTGVAKEQPLHFQEGPAWTLKEQKVGERYTKYLTGGLGGRHTEDMRFVVTEGSLPEGLYLEEKGYITGSTRRPCKAGAVGITVYRGDTALETFNLDFEGVIGPMLTIDKEEYYLKENASGDGWYYNYLTQTLVLDQFEGNYIASDDKLTIVLKNQNQIKPLSEGQDYGIRISGALTVQGLGSLDVIQEQMISETFCGMKVIGNVALESGEVHLRLGGAGNLTGIETGKSINLSAANLSLQVMGKQAAGIKGTFSSNGTGSVSISAIGQEGAVCAETWNSSIDYKGKATISASSDTGSAIAICALDQISAAPGGEINIEKGLVFVPSLEWDGLDYNVKIQPEDCQYKAVSLEDESEERIVISDRQGVPLDGGIYFIGTDLKLERPVSFTVDETWKIPEMTIYENIEKIDFRDHVIVEDHSNVTFGIVEGALPEGITLYESGYISGSPKIPCDSGQVLIQLYDDGEPITYIEPFSISYGQVFGEDTKLTINGVTYSRRTDLSGDGWSYDVVTKTLMLDGYDGGEIESEKRLTIQLKGKNTIRPTGKGTKKAGIFVQNGDLIIQHSGSNEDDKLFIESEKNQIDTIYGIYMQNGFIDFYGGSLSIRLHNENGAAKGTYYMNLLRMYDDANLEVSVQSDQRAAVGIERIFAYGHGNIDIDVQGNGEWEEISYAVDNLAIEDESGVTMSIDSTLNHIDGSITPGIATKRLSELEFKPGGRLDIERGVVCFLFEPVNEYVQVEPAAYYIDMYAVTSNEMVQTMHDVRGIPITENISFIGTEEKQPLIFTPAPHWRLAETKVYASSSISFESGFGKRPHDVEYKVVEGTLPSGMDFIHYHDQLEGYPIETCDAGEVTIAVICDDVEISRFILPYGAVTSPDEKRIPVIHFYQDEHVVVLGEPYRFSYDIDNFESSVMERTFSSSDESIGIATCITSGVYPADFQSFKAGVVTITISLNLPDVVPASATFYVREKTPKAYFEDGIIKGLDPNGTYEINGEFRFADKEGCIAVEQNWSDSRVRIQKVHDEPRCDSDIQTLYVLTADNVEVADEKLVYSGKKITPTVVVSDGEKTLIEHKDYEVAYANNLNAGTAKVMVTGMGVYEGTVEKTFQIDRASITENPASLSKQEYTYSGSAKKPDVSIPGLEEDKDYTVSYKDNTDAGKATVVVSGVGNYKGKMNLSFKIMPKKISSVTLSSTSYVYNGKVKKPAVTVKSGTTKILNRKVKGNQCVQVSYASGRKHPGSYRVTVKGIGNYTGIISKTFQIKVKNTTMKSVSGGSKRVTVKWTKLSSKYVTGYQIRYSRNANMSNAHRTTLIKRTTTSKTIKNLKAKKTYYIQIRSYKTINGKKYYSSWSKVKKIKTKS